MPFKKHYGKDYKRRGRDIRSGRAEKRSTHSKTLSPSKTVGRDESMLLFDVGTYPHLFDIIFASSTRPTLATLLRCSKALFTAVSPLIYRDLSVDDNQLKALTLSRGPQAGTPSGAENGFNAAFRSTVQQVRAMRLRQSSERDIRSPGEQWPVSRVAECLTDVSIIVLSPVPWVKVRNDELALLARISSASQLVIQYREDWKSYEPPFPRPTAFHLTVLLPFTRLLRPYDLYSSTLSSGSDREKVVTVVLQPPTPQQYRQIQQAPNQEDIVPSLYYQMLLDSRLNQFHFIGSEFLGLTSIALQRVETDMRRRASIYRPKEGEWRRRITLRTFASWLEEQEKGFLSQYSLH